MTCNRRACVREAHPECTHTDGRPGAYCLQCALTINYLNGKRCIRLPLVPVYSESQLIGYHNPNLGSWGNA